MSINCGVLINSGWSASCKHNVFHFFPLFSGKWEMKLIPAECYVMKSVHQYHRLNDRRVNFSVLGNVIEVNKE